MFKNKLVLLASLFTNMGIVLTMPITTLYIHETLHKSLVVAGFVLMTFSIAMMAGNLLGGFLFDHWKQKSSMYFGGSLTVLSLGLISIFPIWQVYSSLVMVYGFGLGILSSNINGYLAFLQADDSQIFNNNYWLASLGSGLASFLSGILFSLNVRLVFAFSTVLFLATLVIIRTAFHNLTKHKSRSQTQGNRSFHLVHLNQIGFICLGFVVAWIGYEQWNSNISTLMVAKGISIQAYSLLFTINALVLLLFQPLTRFIFKDSFVNDKFRIVAGILIFALSYVAIINAAEYWRFVIGIIILTFGEILAFPAIPSMLNRYATDNDRGRFQSLGSLAGSLGRAIGPVAGGYIVTSFSYEGLFLLIVFLHLVSAFLILTLKAE